jgi:hypothetical protein
VRFSVSAETFIYSQHEYAASLFLLERLPVACFQPLLLWSACHTSLSFPRMSLVPNFSHSISIRSLIDDTQVGLKQVRQHIAPHLLRLHGLERLVDEAAQHHITG